MYIHRKIYKKFKFIKLYKFQLNKLKKIFSKYLHTINKNVSCYIEISVVSYK